MQEIIDTQIAKTIGSAPAMMKRMTISITDEITQDSKLEGGSYCCLLLRTSSNDLQKLFSAELIEELKLRNEHQNSTLGLLSGLSLSIESDELKDESSDNDFKASDEAFNRLSDAAQRMQIKRIKTIDREFFMKPFNSSLDKVLSDPSLSKKIRPYANRVLNKELVRIYGEIQNSLTNASLATA